jgi:tetratricopeptide (TPR) repeat protein
LGIVVVLWLLHQTISGGQKRWTFRALGTLVVIGSTAACLILRASLERQWREDVRPFLWKGTVQMIAARAVFGYGLGTFVIAYPPFRLPEYFLLRKATNVTDHPHNELLEIAAEQGMLGVAATLWLWSTAFWPGLRAVRKGGAPQQGHWGLLGAAIVLLVHGMLDVGLRYPPDQTLFWLLLGLLAGSGEAGARSQPKLLASSVARIGLAATCWLLAAWAVAQAVVQPLRADLWERRAHLAEADGDLVNASVAAEQSLEAEPFRLRVRYFLASVIARANTSKADERAIEVLKSLELIAPDYANIQYNLGSLYVRRGQFAEALPHLQRAVKTDPYKSDLHLSLAAALERLGQSAAAAQERAKAAALAEQGF